MSLSKFASKMSWMAWTLRYWVLWKYREQARIVSLVLLPLILSVAIYQIITNWQGRSLAVVSWSGDNPVPVLLGVMGWDDVIYYVVALIITAAISYATAPTPQAPEVRQAEVPQVRDGASIVRVYGEVWIDDPVILGWAAPAQMPITQGAGK